MKLIKLQTDHYISVDDSEIKEGDFYYLPRTNFFYKCKEDPTELNLERSFGVAKITGSTQPLGFLNEADLTTANLKPDWINVKPLPLQEVKELLGVVDVEKKAEEFSKKMKNDDDAIDYGFIEGYNQCLEENQHIKWTDEDLKEAIAEAWNTCQDNEHNETFTEVFNRIIKSLQPKTEWEVEIVDGKLKII